MLAQRPAPRLATRIDRLVATAPPDSPLIRQFLDKLIDGCSATELRLVRRIGILFALWAFFAAVGHDLFRSLGSGGTRFEDPGSILAVAPGVVGVYAYLVVATGVSCRVLLAAVSYTYRRVLPTVHQEDLDSLATAGTFFGLERLMARTPLVEQLVSWAVGLGSGASLVHVAYLALARDYDPERLWWLALVASAVCAAAFGRAVWMSLHPDELLAAPRETAAPPESMLVLKRLAHPRSASGRIEVRIDGSWVGFVGDGQTLRVPWKAGSLSVELLFGEHATTWSGELVPGYAQTLTIALSERGWILLGVGESAEGDARQRASSDGRSGPTSRSPTGRG